MNKKLFQTVLAAVGLVLLITSFLGIINGAEDTFYAVTIDKSILGNIILDSNLRFYYGLTLGLGLIILWIIPSVEKHSMILRITALMIFLGAVGRVISLLFVGNPSSFFLFFTFLELFFPLLILWHNNILKYIINDNV